MSEIEKHSWSDLCLIENDIVSQTLREGNHWNPHVYHALEPYLDGVVIDAGANVGALTLRFAEKALVVLAFEPNREMLKCLRLNVHRLGGVVAAIGEGLYSRPVTLAPLPRTDSPSSWPWLPIAEGRADGLYAGPLAWKLKTVTAIKVDVQGADLHAMQGCSEVIVRDRPAIVFEYEDLAKLHGHTWEDYERQLAAWGYRWEQIGGFNDYLALPK